MSAVAGRTVAIHKDDQEALIDAHLRGEHHRWVPFVHDSMLETHAHVFNGSSSVQDKLAGFREGVRSGLVHSMVTFHKHEAPILQQTLEAAQQGRKAPGEIHQLVGDMLQSIQNVTGHFLIPSDLTTRSTNFSASC
ncbi:MAG: hypothetical protein M1821_005797 [Bathelium mastoideum]|nr:MAG: hypothetical protein M1821_005797 [Bathelium mastoideum]